MIKKIIRHNNSILIIICVVAYAIAQFNFFQFEFFDPQFRTESAGFNVLPLFFLTQIPALFGIIAIRAYPPYKNNYLSINSFLNKEKVVKYYVPVLLTITLMTPLLLFKTQSENAKLYSYVIATHYGVLAVFLVTLFLKLQLYPHKINFYKSVFNVGYIALNWQILNYTTNIATISILIIINITVILFGILSSYSFQKNIQIEESVEPVYVKYTDSRKYFNIRMKITTADNRKMMQILKEGELVRENEKEYIKIQGKKIRVIETDQIQINPYSIPYSIFTGA
jgi:hypothetical protein